MVRTTRWDAAAHINTPEDVAACIEAVLEENDPALLAAMLRDISRSQGLIALAEHAVVSPDVLCGMLEPDGRPSLSDFMSLLKVLDLHLTVAPNQTV